MKRSIVIVALALSAAACTLGPNYHRPPVAMPAAFRDSAMADQPPESASLGDVHWFDLFKDEALTELVQTALARNFDVKIAAERVCRLANASESYEQTSFRLSSDPQQSRTPGSRKLARGHCQPRSVRIFLISRRDLPSHGNSISGGACDA